LPVDTSGIRSCIAKVDVGDAFPVRIMGVINLTRNSFYKGSVKTESKEIRRAALKMEEEGADFIDIGARSTAPYRTSEVRETTEARLLSSALKILSREVKVPISVDTTRVLPAKQALDEGAQILNDPYGFIHGQGRELAHLASEKNVPVVITAHEVFSGKAHNPIERVHNALVDSLEIANASGINTKNVVIDPGIGFFSDEKISNVEWNTSILAQLQTLRKFRKPILVGVSRKKFLGILGGGIPAEQRLPGSLAATAIAVYNGAHIVRTHDVEATKQAIAVASKIKGQAAKGLSDVRQFSFS
jgi:dihydropteroate synthase